MIGAFFKMLFFCYFFFFVFTTQTVNERSDDPDARPMLYDPLQGGHTSKTNQYLATVIGKYGFFSHFIQKIDNSYSKSMNPAPILNVQKVVEMRRAFLRGKMSTVKKLDKKNIVQFTS